MPTAEKARSIETAREWYSKSVGLVFTDFRGLKVSQMQELRRNLAEKGGELHVLKNTLFRVAVGDDLSKLPDELHNGPTAVAFVYENESECAKALFDYAKTNKNLKIKGGFFNGQSFDAARVEALSKLPPRDVLIAQVIGTIVAPLTGLVGVVEALYADPIRVIGAVSDKVGEGAPQEPAPEEPKAQAEASVSVEAPAAEEPPSAEAEAPAGEGARAETAPEEIQAEAEATAPEAGAVPGPEAAAPASDVTPAAEAAPTQEAEEAPAQAEEAAPAAEENQE